MPTDTSAAITAIIEALNLRSILPSYFSLAYHDLQNSVIAVMIGYPASFDVESRIKNVFDHFAVYKVNQVIDGRQLYHLTIYELGVKHASA
jgi:hypothetical protein